MEDSKGNVSNLSVKRIPLKESMFDNEITRLLKTGSTSRETSQAGRRRETRKAGRSRKNHALELKKLEIAAETSDFVDSELLTSAQKVVWQSQLRKSCTSSEDIGLYFVHFERVMKRVQIPNTLWMACLVNQFPTEIAQMIMREPEELSENYEYVKSLLLKRYKLSAEKFRQLFFHMRVLVGFNQIPMDEESSRKAAFTTPDGHYESTRLFFWIIERTSCISTRHVFRFRRFAMERCLMFCDDIFFGWTDFDDMIEKLRQVLEKLLNAGLTLKLSKCEFGMSEIEYLGFVIDKGGIRLGPRKLAAIAEYPVPKSKDELRRFLGFTSFFRRFIAHYASVAEPLTRLLKKNSLFIWTVDKYEAFEEFRSRLISRPPLKLFDPKDETELHTDASSVGLAVRTRKEKQLAESFDLIDGILSIHRESGDECIHHELAICKYAKTGFVMPKSMRKYLAVLFHDFGGHFGMEKVVQMIRKKFWFPRMTSCIKQHIRQCVVCAYSKVSGGKGQGKLNSISPGSRPFEVIHMDFLGPFVTSTSRNKELLVFIDNMTKYVRLRPCPSCSTKNVLKYLDEFTNDFGCARRIATDRGSCFSSSLFEDYCKQFGIKHTLNSKSHKDSDKILPEVQRCINWSPSKSTGKPPFELLYGYTPVKLGHFPQDLLTTSNEYVKPTELQRDAQKNIRNSKTQAKYRCPLTIIKVLSSDTYQVTDLRTVGQGRKRQPSYTTTAHASELKLFHLITEDEDLSDGDSEDLITSYCNDGSDENSCIENTQPARVRRMPHRLKDYKLY
ncbi:Retrovirus-related Pol polyprotein like [Argiope bruennichi]|uniref:RNA-directed DNA polymerase n=1 Tax=Argiope bruennichi TaxID=94029 RepID=A0A8T0FL90_ARGBR|nr:Retrovirus-related Pol polyprotein like [Argiope bruennichi]